MNPAVRQLLLWQRKEPEAQSAGPGVGLPWGRGPVRCLRPLSFPFLPPSFLPLYVLLKFPQQPVLIFQYTQYRGLPCSFEKGICCSLMSSSY